MADEELLGCPFCGSPAHIIEGHRDHFRVQCSKCGANIGEFFANRSIAEDRQRAAEAWNRRAAHSVMAGRIAELEAERDSLRKAGGYDMAVWSMRQAQTWRHTPLDKVFAEANEAIETWGAHPDLTSAQRLVMAGWNFINHWIEAGASGASAKARAALAPYPERRHE